MRQIERQLVFQWLFRLAEQTGRYEVNNRHVCHHQASAVIRPFPWVHNFYGCLECGRYHLCHLHELTCEVVVGPDAQLTCIHSGRLLKDAATYGTRNYVDDQRIHEEAISHDGQLYTYVSSECYKAKKQCYTNQASPGLTEDEEEGGKKRRREWEDEPKKKPKRTEEASDDEDGDGVVSGPLRTKNVHPNRAYWDEFFGFIVPQITLKPLLRPSMPLPVSQAKSDQISLSEKEQDEIKCALTDIVGRLLRHQLGQTDNFERLRTSIVAHFRSSGERICLLILRDPYNKTSLGIPLICAALMDSVFSTRFTGRDAHGNQIEIWAADPWLLSLQKTGLLSRLSHSVKSLSNAVRIITQSLSRHRDNALWLRAFIFPD